MPRNSSRPDYDEVTEGKETQRREKLKTKWAALEAIVGTEKRLDVVARDLVKHFEDRPEANYGKGMIVCMSRRICVDLYNAIVKLRPDWHGEGDGIGQAQDRDDWRSRLVEPSSAVVTQAPDGPQQQRRSGHVKQAEQANE
jgi:hypothetical protein